MSGTPNRPDGRRDAAAHAKSGAEHSPGDATRPQRPRSVGRTHQLYAFVFLGLTVLAFVLSYALGLIHLPD